MFICIISNSTIIFLLNVQEASTPWGEPPTRVHANRVTSTREREGRKPRSQMRKHMYILASVTRKAKKGGRKQDGRFWHEISNRFGRVPLPSNQRGYKVQCEEGDSRRIECHHRGHQKALSGGTEYNLNHQIVSEMRMHRRKKVNPTFIKCS